MPKRRILFLGGPSGSGKSYFAEKWLSTKHGWLHLEIDGPANDGINVYQLRAVWDEYYERFRPVSLHAELLSRADSSQHIVLSFASNLVFSTQHVQAGRGYFNFAYLYGHPALCLRAFLEREQASGRRLQVDHWNAYNYRTFGRLSVSLNQPLLIEAFTPEGARRDPEQIYADILAVINKG